MIIIVIMILIATGVASAVGTIGIGAIVLLLALFDGIVLAIRGKSRVDELWDYLTEEQKQQFIQMAEANKGKEESKCLQ